ncbi:MBOAT membrane-bound O-acyltransferase family protein [Oceanihabitans sediminis]|uniref:Acyltransferase n=1 Tax=Oceanihabitans sediminis TaxID=1812012 RepID=A0A368P0S1_9FLAO|nr:MBOAT family O-acyltransferase [Oceanihabitans sediminis]MDX1774783.1 MBOAT family O-acyltransferase [Oceanihabitans sediminis]RBP27689.1 MBOAT membrane-bound O-acyltransferase family protein [Oceanihabitans sediminis]RCU56422.1 acyltransferase [Oceanihabitans sediminis]
MKLNEYVKKRNGVPLGNSKSLPNNIYRALGAKNFSSFWNYWNPIFGYYLGIYIFKPLKKKVPKEIALLATFIFCGMVHDAVTIAVRWKVSFFFTIWFVLMGIALIITRYFNQNVNKQIWAIRALINLSIIALCFILTIYLRKLT